jgi:glutathione S-transferase
LNTLVTISFSHYCEKARWALDLAGVPYREEAYVPGTHYLGTLRRGGRSTPLLVLDDGRTLTDSRDIVRFADECRPGCLFPEGHRDEIDELEALFDAELGPRARLIVYSALLEANYPFVSLVRSSTTGVHRALAPLLGVVVPQLVKRGLRVDAQRAARARERLEPLLAQVEARLADGRRYLVADRFTAADLTFASLLAPMNGPPEQPITGAMPVDETIERIFAETRARPAGAFAMRLYAEERGRARLEVPARSFSPRDR